MKNWIKNNNRNVELSIWLIAMITLLLITSSCSSIKVLPINTPQEKPIDQDIDMEIFQPHYEYCEQFEYDAETWMECMMNEQIRRNTIKRLA